MQLVTGSPDAQYGDKSSLVVNATTKSGLNSKPNGSLELIGGSFGTWGENASFGAGSKTIGNFIVANTMRSGRFLDTPEFQPLHAIGNNVTIFDHLDYQRNEADAYHVNLFAARNWMQIPNSYDQLAQDQKQRVMSYNIAPAYQHTFSSATLLTLNTFVRRDQVNFYGSRDPLHDTPVTSSQLRFLTNYGFKADVATAHRFHTVRYGMQIQRTQLVENFSLGVTDPAFNPVCLGPGGAPVLAAGVTDPSKCASANPAYVGNPGLQPGLVPYDLTRGGTPFHFRGTDGISQYSFYVTDEIQKKNWNINAGIRDDQYNGLVSRNGLQPRIGLAYTVSRTGTVLRLAYSRTFETPFNENLLLSSSTGSGGLAVNAFGAQKIPIAPGNRNQFNTGFQQKIKEVLVIDADYFWKFTHNAYDFDVLFNTPIAFPIAWKNSKLDGVTGRVSTVSLHGFQAYWTFGHTRARFFPPEVGGLVPQAVASTPGVFRIDHDQAFQHTMNLRYQKGKDGPWLAWTWRYDSGLVVTGVPDTAAALTLTPAQQTTIGLACDGIPATSTAPLRSCAGTVTSTLLRLPTPTEANADHNPAKVQPRNVFDLAFGTDNLLRSSDRQVTLRFTLTNVTGKVAVYNFLSTFSGTHFLAPRAAQVALGFNF